MPGTSCTSSTCCGGFIPIYESEPYERKKLKGKALERMVRLADDRMVATYLLREDFQELGVGEEFAEGVIEELRSIKGIEFAMTIREPTALSFAGAFSASGMPL